MKDLTGTELAASLRLERDAVKAFVEILQREQNALIQGGGEDLDFLASNKAQMVKQLADFGDRRNRYLASRGLARDSKGMDAWLAGGPRDTLAERPVAGTGAEARSPQTAGFASNESARPCNAAFTLTPGVALRMLASDRNAWQDVQMSGDPELAREILFVAQNLRWDAEEDLSRVFGDIIAHRMVQTAGNFKHWQRQATDSIARSAAAYWTDEQPLIATRHGVECFVREVDALRDDVARFEKRLQHLMSRQDAKIAR